MPATYLPSCTYVVCESPQPACYSPYSKKAAKTFVSDKQPALNERTVESWSQKHFFFAMAISFYSIRYKLYPRIHTSILCHPVSRLWPASQSVRRGPAGRQPGRGPAGTECRLIDFIAVFELRTLPKGSFPLCIGMFDYKPKICYLPGRKNN